MKLYNISLALLLGIGTLTSCSDKLELTNPNQQTTATFGNSIEELEECVIAAYNHTRIEGSFGRVGYTLDAVRGDEVWNSSQQWYLNYDDMNSTADIAGNDGNLPAWVWREWYYTINVCNYILSKFGDNQALTVQQQYIKGQALFLRGLGYYNLAGYMQTVPLITDYTTYSSLDGLYGTNNSYDELWDQVEKDFADAMELLPSRDLGSQWAQGRATNGAAAGFYARALMMRHKYSDALVVLKDIINGAYGSYKLMANYGDNFREGAAYENNAESLYEVQFLDYGTQGTDDEWTPANTSKNATQGHAVESNFVPAKFGGWADLSVSPWLYNLFKQGEKTITGKLDPRMYWTIGSYEQDWDGFENGNVMFMNPITVKDTIVTNEGKAGGIPIAKWTNMRTNVCASVVTGLHGGVNLRIMRYSDVLLRAAECENEVNGPTEQAIEWINQVRRRANLADLKKSDFGTADKLFEQIANVERPKEFGCEYGRGFDLIRWGFFYNAGRLQQLKEHGTFRRCPRNYDNPNANDGHDVFAPVSYSQVGIDPELKCSFDTYVPGREFLPITSWLTNSNPNLVGNSANTNTSNESYFTGNGWTVHPVVDLDN